MVGPIDSRNRSSEKKGKDEEENVLSRLMQWSSKLWG